MKTIKTNSVQIVLLILLSFSIFNANAIGKNVSTTTYVKIGVDGLACPFCAYGLEKKVKKIDGAKDLYIDINEGFITFAVPTDKKPTEEALKKVVKEAGFKIREIEYSAQPFEIKKDEKK